MKYYVKCDISKYNIINYFLQIPSKEATVGAGPKSSNKSCKKSNGSGAIWSWYSNIRQWVSQISYN